MKIYLSILLILNLFFASEDANWEVLSEQPVLIKVFKSDYPHCHAELIIHNSIDDILKVIQDVNSYKLFFENGKIAYDGQTFMSGGTYFDTEGNEMSVISWGEAGYGHKCNINFRDNATGEYKG